MPGWAIGIPDGMSLVRDEGASCPTESYPSRISFETLLAGGACTGMTRIASSAKCASVGDTTIMENIDPVEAYLWT